MNPRFRHALRSLAAAAALSACAGGNDPVRAPGLDPAEFERTVEPVLETRCANPSCHGNARRALRVYAPDFYRMDPADLHRPGPLAPDEVAANRASAEAFAAGIDAARDSLLYAKPVARVEHEGGAVFAAEGDPEADALLAWLRSGGLP